MVKVRFAPSPTGFLHVGGLRTAFFNFLFARKNSGQFILRIEDTDKSREVAGAVENIIETLKFFKLDFDEGPIFQSKRLEIYQEQVQILLDKGAAYKCYCSAERIAELKKQAELQKLPFRYDKYCLKNPPSTSPLPSPSPGEVKKEGSSLQEMERGEERGRKFVIRQNVPEEGFTEFEDLVHGRIKVENRLLDDGVLIKSDGWPVYNFANVVDDHLMQISHVIRGEEFLPSTPKHILLYQAFGWQPPHFAHLPLLLDQKRHKLSKRTGDVAVREYLNKGYLPEAILNFVAFLGWNPKTEQEIFSLEELMQAFNFAKVNKAGAIFDLGKLDWFNRYYIKQKPLGELANLLKPYIPLPHSLPPREGNKERRSLPPSGAGKGEEEKFLQKIVEIERERLVKLSEIGERVHYFFSDPIYDKELLSWKKMSGEELKSSLQKAKEIVNSKIKNQKSKMQIEKVFLEEIGEGNKGEVLWPLRVALTGLKASPGPFEILEAFLTLKDGKDIILNRIQKAIEKL